MGAGQDVVNGKTLPEIKFADVKKHDKYNDAWMIVHGLVYDVSEWAKRHPGGDVILLGAGTDASVMFESYHPNGVPNATLAKYVIGRIESTAPKSYYVWTSDFYPTMRKRVVEHLRENKLPTRGHMVPKAAIILFFFWLGMYILLFGGSSTMNLFGSIIWGIAATHIGLGIMHDGNHGAFSNNNWLNTIAGWGMDLIGASGFVWEFQHVVGHHQYTNLQTGETKSTDSRQSDPDTFSSYPLVRMHPRNKRQWFNRYQHIYAPILFGLMTLSKVFLVDFQSVTFNRAVVPAGINMNPRLSNPRYLLRFYVMKALTMIIFLGGPIYVHGLSKGFGLYLVGHILCSFYLAICFIVNHISESCAFFEAGKAPIMTAAQQKRLKTQPKSTKTVHERDWAMLQVLSCVNWCSGSTFWNHFSGGLNHQIEHHLFPSISHVHYPAIQKIVKATCQEYGVPYVNHKSFGGAWNDMIGCLYVLGNRD
eukprot:c974_g1_i1.p1 GENE.c974_g1_i1~~c974_g1_i1.p1  ORF type:complete len:477 (+),score=100.23 c974_g1_i1:44-1474(+)